MKKKSETGFVIGIDLGTTFSAAAVFESDGKAKNVPNADGDSLTPSVVNLRDEQHPVVGRPAVNQYAFAVEYTASLFKRMMGRVDAGGRPVPAFVHPDSGKAHAVHGRRRRHDVRQRRKPRTAATRNWRPSFVRSVATLIADRVAVGEAPAVVTAAATAFRKEWRAVCPRCRCTFSPKVCQAHDMIMLRGVATHGSRRELDGAVQRIYASHKSTCPACGRRTRLACHIRQPDAHRASAVLDVQ
jgi:hypothetical protein